MTLSKTRVEAVDLGELGRQMRDIFAGSSPERSEDRLTELAKIVGRNNGIGDIAARRDQGSSAASADPSRLAEKNEAEPGLEEDRRHAEDGSTQDGEKGDDPACKDDGVKWTSKMLHDAASVRSRAARRLASLPKLALIVPLLLAAVGFGTSLVMRGGPTDAPRGKLPMLDADSAGAPRAMNAADDEKRPQSALADSSTLNPPVDLVAAATPAAPIAAASLSLPNPPPAAADSSNLGSVPPLAAISTQPAVSEGKPEATPLPPTKPKTLTSAHTTILGKADTTGRVVPAATKEAEATRVKPSDGGTDPAGTSSFSIQLASSASKDEALAILSRLQKQFPHLLSGGSIRQADLGSKGVFYRVQVGSLSRSSADKICSQLKASGESCIVTRG